MADEVPVHNWSFGMVHLSCKATVRGQPVTVMQSMPEMVYDDPAAREAVERALRYALLEQILKGWTPVITVRRG